MRIWTYLPVIMLLMASAVSILPAASAADSTSLPTEGWTVNNWRKNDATATISFTQTPDAQDAIAIEFKGKPSPNVVSPDLSKLSKDWPEEFGEVGFYCHGDGSNQLVSMVFSQGKEQYAGNVVLSHTGWKYVTLTSVWKRKDLPPMSPNKLVRFVFSSTAPCKVAFGPLQFLAPSVPMNLKIGTTGHAVFTATPPVIDGRLDDAVWDRAPWQITSYPITPASAPAVGRARFRILYDNENIYVAAKVEQSEKLNDGGMDLTGDNAPLWDDEAVEVFFNPTKDLTTFYQLIVNRKNTHRLIAHRFVQMADDIVTDPEWKWPGLETRTINEPNQWTTEWKLPWKAIGHNGPPTDFYLQLMHNDWRHVEKGSEGGVLYHAVWSPTKIRSKDLWGYMTLLQEPQANRGQLVATIKEFVRLKPGTYRLSVDVSQSPASSKPLGKLKVNVSLAAPSRQQDAWEREVDAPGATYNFTDTFTTKAFSSGLHRLSVQVSTAAADHLVPTQAMAEFVEEIPVDVSFGDLVLNPKPKQLKQTSSQFKLKADDTINLPANATARTRKTAAFLAERLYGHFGMRPKVVVGNAASRIQLRVDTAGVKNATGQQDVTEAYTLKTGDKGIDLTGGGEAGLYYAVVTLNQLARISHSPHTPITGVEIVDWPSLKQRIYNEWASTLYRPIKQAPDMEQYKKIIEKVVAGSKFNVFVLTMDRSFKYEKHPTLSSPSPMFDAASYREISDWAKDHFIELVPAVLYGSHSSWVALRFPEMVEKGFYGNQQLDVTHPQFIPMMEDIVGEVLDAAGPGTHRFMIWNDEWWAKPTKAPSLTHNGMTRQQMFLKTILAEHAFLKSKGVRMMMFTDMIDPNHGGGAPFNLHEIIKDLPRDITMCTWSGSSPAWLKKLGFEVAIVNNNFIVPPANMEKVIDGFGTIVYSVQHAMFSHVDDQKTAAYSWHATLRAADYAWNIGVDSNLPRDEWARWNMTNLMPNYALDDVPHGGAPVNVQMPTDEDLAQKLGMHGSQMVGDIDMALSPVKVATEPVTVKLKEPALVASVITLAAVQFKDATDRKAAQKESTGYGYVGLPVGTLTVTYQDGSNVSFPLRLGVNTIDTVTPVLNRYVLLNARATMDFGTGEALLQAEWVNPDPQRKVASITIEAANAKWPVLWASTAVRPFEQ